ncbi:MAG: class I SAM-dependent methyltransferase [Thermoanaerobaculum sp.]|nr:class I SAM-dependent methyltransferase [Thermoanaerobaculum sp.]
MGEGSWRERLAAARLEQGLVEGLARFLDLLQKWGRVCDLTAVDQPEELIRDHVLESLVASPWLHSGRLLDLGSGNGFPAIPLLLARGDVRGLLVEPRLRRWAFLKEAVRELGLRAEVWRGRVEDVEVEGAENLTVRALAPRVWAPEVGRLVGLGGRVFWWAGSRAEAAPPTGFSLVVTCPLPNPTRGRLVVWGRCST